MAIRNQNLKQCLPEMNERVDKDLFTIIFHVETFNFSAFELLLQCIVVTEKSVYKF